MAQNDPNTPPTPPPPPAANRLVRYILGFGVSVAVGLAPYLGKVGIPGFEPLLNILPPSEHGVAIPVSAALMGIIAVAVQWYANERLSRGRLRKAFIASLLLAIASVIALYVINTMVVTRVPVGRDGVAVILHGFGSATCEECDGKSNVECLRHISFDPGRVESCWGTSAVQNARLSLTLSYFAATGMFGAIVGFLVVAPPRRRN